VDIFCPNCGQQSVSSPARFCFACGTKLPDVGCTNAPENPVRGNADPQTQTPPVNQLQEAKQPPTQPPPVKQLQETKQAPAAAVKQIAVSLEPAPIVQKAAPRKWGWGWYVLAGVFVAGFNKSCGGYGIVSDVTELGGLGISCLLYFALRNKVLTRISSPTTRSFVAGVLSYVVVAVAAGVVVAVFARSVERSVALGLQSQTSRVSAEGGALLAKEAELWSKVNLQAASKADMQQNIVILQELAVVTDRKAAIFADVVQSYSSLLDGSVHEYPALTNRLDAVITAMKWLKEKEPPLRFLTQNMISNLSNCYASALESGTAPSDCAKGFEADQSKVGELAEEFSTKLSQLAKGSPGR